MAAPPSVPPPTPHQTLCVCDAHDEAERYVKALRAQGYAVTVIDLASLVVHAQEALPTLVVCDVDAAGALDAIRQLHALPGGSALEVLAVGEAGRTLAQRAEAVALHSSGQLVRPVDPDVLVLTVETRIGAPPAVTRADDEPGSLPFPSLPPGSETDHAAVHGEVEISSELSELLRAAEERAANTLQVEPEVPSDDGDPQPNLISSEALEMLSQPLPNAGDRDANAGLISPSLRALPSSIPPGTGVPLSDTSTSLYREVGAADAADEPTRSSGKASGSGTDAQTDAEGSSPLSVAERATLPPPRYRSEPAPAAPAESTAGITSLPQRMAEGEIVQVLGEAVQRRWSGALAFETDDGVRRVLLQDGDIVTVVSGTSDESLVGFLASTGELDPHEAANLAHRLPPFGRHTGTALIARGKLRQEQLWPTLRAHAEWLLSRALSEKLATLQREHDIPERLAAEPTVFGGAAGAEVLIDGVRRAIEPSLALRLLGGETVIVGSEPNRTLLGECALSQGEAEALEASLGLPLGEAARRSPLSDLPSLLLALRALGVIQTSRTSQASARQADVAPVPQLRAVANDGSAWRARITARKALVDHGDYFSLLGVSPAATAYDIQRAYQALKREFEPSLLGAETADLSDTLIEIGEVLDEAYAVLHDDARRMAYRRAIG